MLDHWWEQVLHNQSALLLRARLRARPNTVVTSVPFHLRGDEVEVVGSVDGVVPPGGVPLLRHDQPGLTGRGDVPGASGRARCRDD